MKILITGCEGYVGSLVRGQLEIVNEFYSMNDYSIELEIIGLEKINDFNLKKLRSTHFDFIFHCAVIGGRSYEQNNEEIYFDNLNVFLDLLTLSSSKIIHFSSAADLDRENDIDLADPSDVLIKTPKDYFGKAKNEISKIIIDKDLGINLRVFNLFGSHRYSRYQMIDNLFKWSKTKKEIIIQNDRYFDFFFIEDLRPIIYDIITEKLEEDINLCYQKKYLISEVAEHIQKLLNTDSKIFIQSKGKSYTGSNKYLSESFRLDLLDRISFYHNSNNQIF
jgi:nucleoside-diphosphate-sugar epimerase